MLDVKDRLLMPALAAGEESVVSGIATLMAELGQAVHNRASLFLSFHQCIIATLGVKSFHTFCKIYKLTIREIPRCYESWIQLQFVSEKTFAVYFSC